MDAETSFASTSPAFRRRVRAEEIANAIARLRVGEPERFMLEKPYEEGSLVASTENVDEVEAIATTILQQDYPDLFPIQQVD